MDTSKIIYGLLIIVTNFVFFGFVYWALALSSNDQFEIIAIALTILYIGSIVLGVFGFGPINRLFKEDLIKKKAEENEQLKTNHPWE